VAAAEFRNEIERHAGQVSQRLVFVPDQSRHNGEEIVRADYHFVMIRVEGARDHSRVFQLVRFAFGESRPKKVLIGSRAMPLITAAMAE